jgi:hypothetical protein
MMAALFLLMTCVIAAVYLGKRLFGVIALLITLGFCWLMLWHHATDILKINW